MDMEETIYGHETVKAELARMIREDRVPHALLFTGPEGVGKRKMAEAFAMAMLCFEKKGVPCGHCEACRAMQRGAHPEFHVIEPEQRGKGTRQIRIETIREMQAKASGTIVFGDRRVIVIDDADCMNEQAENSLLKTLEEPAGAVTFILVTSAESALLDTIRSRCMPIRFGGIPREALEKALRARGVEEAEIRELASLADGSLGRAVRLHEDGGLNRQEDVRAFLRELPRMDMPALWRRAKAMEDMTREELAEWFSFLTMFLRDMLVLYEDGGSPLVYHPGERSELLGMLDAFGLPRVHALFEEVHEMDRRLRANVSLKLQTEGFLIRARAVLRQGA